MGAEAKKINEGKRMDRTRSNAVLTYCDVGNSTKGGFDVVEEIRWLGGARICEVHLKENPHYPGEGKIDFRAVVDALADIGLDGWAQLEPTARHRWRTTCPEPGVYPETDCLPQRRLRAKLE